MLKRKIWLDDETPSTGDAVVPPADQGASGQPAAPLEPPAPLDWVSLLLGLVGFGVALYALIEHVQAKAGGAGQLSCDVNATVSCTNVLTSEYGELIGIPLGAYGMTFWAGVVSIALLPKFVQVSRRYLAYWRLVAASMGFVTAVLLAYIAYFVIQSVCLICSTTQVLCLVFFVFAVVAFFRSRSGQNYAHPNAFMRLLSLVMALGVPPLVAGLIAPSILIDMIRKDKQKEPVAVATPEPGATPIPAELLTVNKSNYVGKGEDYRIGNDNARTVIHMFSDPECPACRGAGLAFEEVIKTVGVENVLFVEHLYPLDSSCNPKSGTLHPNACRLSLAARCAGQQGKFFEFMRWAYESQTLPTSERMSAYSEEGIKSQVSRMKLAVQPFAQCLASKVEMGKIQEDMANADKIGLRGTPMIIINGQKFNGNHGDPAVLEQVIRAHMR
jgi:uncharacterized membrane protein/protein-disulfide isomerase